MFLASLCQPGRTVLLGSPAPRLPGSWLGDLGALTVHLTFSVTCGILTEPFFLPGFERHVCGWEAWLPHVCVWVHSPLCQHPPGPQWPTEKGHSLWRDSDCGEEGVPRPPGGAGGLQWILLASPGWTDEGWLGGQLAWRGTAPWCVCVVVTGGLLTYFFFNGKEGGSSRVCTRPQWCPRHPMLACSIISLCLIHLKPREYTYEVSVLL